MGLFNSTLTTSIKSFSANKTGIMEVIKTHSKFALYTVPTTIGLSALKYESTKDDYGKGGAAAIAIATSLPWVKEFSLPLFLGATALEWGEQYLAKKKKSFTPFYNSYSTVPTEAQRSLMLQGVARLTGDRASRYNQAKSIHMRF